MAKPDLVFLTKRNEKYLKERVAPHILKEIERHESETKNVTEQPK